MDSSICILTVFYNPTQEQIKRADALACSARAIVVDNSNRSIPEAENAHFLYIPLLENKGIAYAQNVGIRKAHELGYGYILFQDQDSLLKESQIEALFNEYRRVEGSDSMTAAIGPVIINAETNQEYKNLLGESDTAIVPSIISSGMLARTSIFDEVGLMDEDLFIDNVDHEWCWRARSKGYNIYMTRLSCLEHTVGMKTKTVGGIQIIKSKPVRSYYKFRNNIILFRRNYVPRAWKSKARLRMLVDLLTYVLSPREYGVSYVKNALKGISDGFKYNNSHKKKEYETL